MVISQAGSIRDYVHEIVLDIPTLLSGAPVVDMIDRGRIFAQNQLGGVTINGSDVDEKFIQILTDLGAANLLNAMELEGSDAQTVKLGDFTVEKGGEGVPVSKARSFYFDRAEQSLRLIGRKVQFQQVFG